jgi:tetratricopeptide (TPR) repeat protein
MLETIREYASERLQESGEAEELRRMHADYYLEVAEAAGLSIAGLGRRSQRPELVLPELDNLRSALDWTVDNDIDLGLSIAVALENHWATRDPADGRRRLELLLERGDGIDPILLGHAWRDLGACYDVIGDFENARRGYQRSRRLFLEAGDEGGVVTADFRLGVVAAESGDLESAKQLWEACLEAWSRLGDTIGEIQAFANLGFIAYHEQDLHRARELWERSVALSGEVGWTWFRALGLANLAQLAIEEHRIDEGAQLARECLELGRAAGDRNQVIYCLALLAWAAAETGDTDRAARLWATVAVQEPAPGKFWQVSHEEFADRVPPIPTGGLVMSLEEAVESALADA